MMSVSALRLLVPLAALAFSASCSEKSRPPQGPAEAPPGHTINHAQAHSLGQALARADQFRIEQRFAAAQSEVLRAPPSLMRDQMAALVIREALDADFEPIRISGLDTIANPVLRAESQTALGLRLIETGYLHEARQSAAGLGDDLNKASLFAAIGHKLARAGYRTQAEADLQRATYIALKSSPCPHRDRVFQTIAWAHTTSGHKKQARYARDRIKAHNLRAALRSASLPATNSFGAEIVKAVKQGDNRRAHALVAWANTDKDYSELRALLVGALADHGHFVEAMVKALAANSVSQQTKMLRAIAHRSLEKQRLDFAANPDLSPKIATPPDRVRPLWETADATIYPLQTAPIRSPSIPRLIARTGRAFARTIPPIAPGRAVLTPIALDALGPKNIAGVVETALAKHGGLDALARAQAKPRPTFVHLETGVWDLPTLWAHFSGLGTANPIVRDDRSYTLNQPLLVDDRASLVISSADVKRLSLSQDNLTFIAVRGRFLVHGTSVEGWNTKAGRLAETPPDGSFPRPFIVVWSGGVAEIGDTSIRNLGFNAARAYGLTFAAGPWPSLSDRQITPPAGAILDSTISDLYYGLYSDRAENLAIIGNFFERNEVYAIDPHDYSRALLIALNTTISTRQKHGIIISRGVSDSQIIGNLVAENAGAGIMLDRHSARNLVFGNRVVANGGAALAVYESSCNLLLANHLDGKTGLAIRNSRDIAALGNTIAAKGRPAIELSALMLDDQPNRRQRDLARDPYQPGFGVTARANTIHGTPSASLTSNGPGTIDLAANHWAVRGQQPFGGALAPLASQLMAAGPQERRISFAAPQIDHQPCPLHQPSTEPRRSSTLASLNQQGLQ